MDRSSLQLPRMREAPLLSSPVAVLVDMANATQQQYAQVRV